MSEKYDIEDDYAKNALETAVEIMGVPGETRERLAAARLVLDFTKSRPASKQEVTIGKAEEFLASLLDEDENGPEATTGRKRLATGFEFYSRSSLKTGPRPATSALVPQPRTENPRRCREEADGFRRCASSS